MIMHEAHDSILHKKCDKHKISAKGIYVEALILLTCIAQKELLNSLLNGIKMTFCALHTLFDRQSSNGIVKR